MRLEVTFRNTRATDAVRERAEKKFEKVAKHLREPIEAHMVIRVEKHRHLAELTVHAAGRQYFDVSEETDDMYATIDGIMSKLERTVRRHKERMNDRVHHASRPDESLVRPEESLVTDVDDDEDDNYEV